MNHINKITASFLTTLVLAGCGQESSVNVIEDPLPPIVGQFVDAPVAGLSYSIQREASGETEAITGVTDANGNFDYFRGDSITFSIGEIVFPATAAGNYITPMQVFGVDNAYSQNVTNTLRLLQSLDVDGDSSNGIEISADARENAALNLKLKLIDGELVDETIEEFFNRSDKEFAAGIDKWLANAGTVNTSVVSKGAATKHFVDYIYETLNISQSHPFNVNSFDGEAFNPVLVNDAIITNLYNFTPNTDDDTNSTGSYVYTDADTSIAPVNGTYEFIFGLKVLKLTSDDNVVTYLISQSYNTITDVHNLCQETAAETELSTLVDQCRFSLDAGANLLTFSQSKADAAEVALEASKDDVGVELIEGFTTDFDTFTKSDYKYSVPGKPLYIKTGGAVTIDPEKGELSMPGGRFSIGNAAPKPEIETAATDTVGTGIYNISEGFTISFDIVAIDTSGSLSLYIDNNSTSQGKSIHGDPSKFFGKSLADVATWDEFTPDTTVGIDGNGVGKFKYTYIPGNDVVTGLPPVEGIDRGALNTTITNSFFQLRTDGTNNITITNLRIDTVANSIDASDLFVPPSSIKFTDLVDFTEAKEADVFTPEYLNLAGAETTYDDVLISADDIAMFNKTGETVELEAEGIALTGGRFTMGDYLPDETTSTDDTNSSGVLDLSKPYQILVTFAAITTGDSDDKFEIYVDNDTTDKANSMYGDASLIHQVDTASLSVETVTLDNDGTGFETGTSISFLQFASTGTSKVVIKDIKIEAFVPPAPIKVSLPFNVDFTETDTASLFTTAYLAVDGIANSVETDIPMYFEVAGTMVVTETGLLLGDSKLTVGNTTPNVDTTDSDTVNTGVFDLSRPYNIVLDVISLGGSDTTKTFQVYVDNNTGSSASSVHGSDSRIFKEKISDMSVGKLTIPGNGIGTKNSFIQLRAENGAEIVINNLRIDYIDDSADLSAWGVFNADAVPTAVGSVINKDQVTTFEEGGSDLISDSWTAVDGIGTFDTTAGNIKTYADFGPIVGDTFPKEFTMVARLANANAVSKSFEIEMAFGGDTEAGRLKFMLRDSKVQFEKFDGSNTEEWSFGDDFDVTEFHDYHVKVTLTSALSAEISLYVDGDDTVLHTATTDTLRSTDAGRNEIRIGENGSGDYEAEIDWIIWSDSGAFTPSELKGKLPASLGDVSNYEAPGFLSNWGVFNADAVPTAADSVINNGAVATFEEGGSDLIADSWTVTNGIGTFDTTAGNIKAYADFGPIVGDTFPKEFTMVARLANANAVSKSFEIEMAFGGDTEAGRLKFMLRDSKVQFEKFDGSNTEEWSFGDDFDVTQFHDYQVKVILTSALSAEISLYIDGDDTVLHTATTDTLRSTDAGRNEIRIGENGSGDYEVQVDWIIWSDSGAFTPSDLKGNLPASLGDVSNYPAPPAVSWGAFNADAVPTAVDSLLNDGVVDTFEEGGSDLIADSWTVTNGIGTFDTTAGNIKAYADFGPIVGDTFPKEFTMVARLANTNAVSKSFEIEMAYGGDTEAGRLKFMLRDSKVQFEKFDGSNTEEWSFGDDFDVTEFHDYHVKVTLTSALSAEISLYVDGDDTVLHTATTDTLRSTDAGRNEIRIGENGSGDYEAEIDWIIWTADGAFLPSELAGELPSGLGNTSNY